MPYLNVKQKIIFDTIYALFSCIIQHSKQTSTLYVNIIAAISIYNGTLVIEDITNLIPMLLSTES